MMNNVIISGATSMIGIALTEYCVKKNIQVFALVRSIKRAQERLPSSPYVHLYEFTNETINELVLPISIPVDAFFYLTWSGTRGEQRDDKKLQHQNIIATLNAVSFASKIGCKTFVGVGSQAEYGKINSRISETQYEFPTTEYGKAKLQAKIQGGLLAEQLKLRFIWTRVFSAYGPYDTTASLISYCIRSILKGENPQLTSCEQLWDYVYCKDVAKALYTIAQSGKNANTYNIAFGVARQLKEYVSIIANECDTAIPIQFGSIPNYYNQSMNLEADISKLIADTGFVPEYSFEEGIRETIAWVKEHEKL